MFYVVWENESVSESCVDINEWKKPRNLECFGERDLQINKDNVLITCLCLILMAVWLVPVSLIFIDAISLQLTNQATKASLKGLLKQIFIYINIPVIYLEF